ncbi:hypothetical protein GmRootV59_03500 [Variovorax sp. V59]
MNCSFAQHATGCAPTREPPPGAEDFIPTRNHPAAMKVIHSLYAAIHALMALAFAAASLVLVVIAARAGWGAVMRGLDLPAAEAVIEAVGLLAAGVVALQISQTVLEEEVVRDAHIGAPTRVRRFLSRFMVVIVVAVAVEGLVATFKAREAPELMLHGAAMLGAVGLLMAGWGLFIRLNRYAEELEPEAMAEAKSEDRKLK